ncbi:MAG: hypothetical protein NMK33_01895 [Candidatus Cardinium sp.]|nr:hypothetical protein FPG78_04575 [Cardinium endosymbiont of Dermatophagoides farinae]UWW97295.1 MAG: hypothetical protein NMK33_01895 [Candidatus Cardinium sp.]
MKAYINYRAALLIGLLSFNTLSACVHTRQALGVNINKIIAGTTTANPFAFRTHRHGLSVV